MNGASGRVRVMAGPATTAFGDHHVVVLLCRGQDLVLDHRTCRERDA